jgi:hypothetical protein
MRAPRQVTPLAPVQDFLGLAAPVAAVRTERSTDALEAHQGGVRRDESVVVVEQHRAVRAQPEPHGHFEARDAEHLCYESVDLSHLLSPDAFD